MTGKGRWGHQILECHSRLMVRENNCYFTYRLMNRNHKRDFRKKQGDASRPAASGREPAVNVVEKGLLEQAREIVDQTPEIRPEKVAAIQEALCQGTYDFDSRKLAKLLITELLLKR
jgi:flagellar biosynthesis anti-sigma factor FlgM